MDSSDLETAISLAIAQNSPGKQPAAVLAAIRETHVVIERGRWERVITVLNDCAAASAIEMVDDAMATLEPGDLDAE
jgi:hypothetical protein